MTTRLDLPFALDQALLGAALSRAVLPGVRIEPKGKGWLVMESSSRH